MTKFFMCQETALQFCSFMSEKKRRSRFSILMFIMCMVAIVGAGCSSSDVGDYSYPDSIYEEYIDDENDFYIRTNGYTVTAPVQDEHNVSLEIDMDTRTIQALSRINFTNRSSKPMDTIVLRVFFNAFQPDVSPRPYTSDLEWRLNLAGSDRGFLSIEYVSINSEILEYEMDGSVLVLYLEEPLEAGASAILRLQYSAYVPMLGALIGGNNYAMWLGMFLPVLSVYGEDGWHTDAFYPVGTPFFIETANYHVEITTPLGYTVVGTGLRTEEHIYDADITITHFSANMVRDFAFAVLSPHYEHSSIETESGVIINFYFNSEIVGNRADEILDFAKISMEHFEKFVGAYPFGQVTIIETDMLRDSIAFSQMIFVDTRQLRHGDLTELSSGLGNQWFASIVGTNRITQPWLDEGLTRFVQSAIANYTQELMLENIRRIYFDIAAYAEFTLSDGLWAYDNRNDFFVAHRYRAMVMLHQLEFLMGSEAFWSFINQYYQIFSFRVATVDDFIDMAEKIHGESLQEFFDNWMNQKTLPPLRS